METATKTIIFVLAVISLGLWILEIHPSIASASMPSISLEPVEPGALASETSTLPAFQENGVLIYDLSHGTPGTPYLVYIDEKGQIMTKQFIEDGNRSCDATAGDMPCGTPENEDPGIAAGTALAVTGGEDDQGVFANSYQTTSMPGNMVEFTLNYDHKVTLSNGTSIALLGTADDVSCTIGDGCFGAGTERAVVQANYNSASTNIEMVPGTLHELGPTTFIPLGITGTGENEQVTFLAVNAR